MTLQTSPFRLTLFDHLNASVLNKTISLRNSVLERWRYKLLERICPKTIVVLWYFLLALFLLFSFKTNYLAAFVRFSLSLTEMQPHLVPLYLSVSAAFVGKTEPTGVHSHLPQNTCYVMLCPGERSDSPGSFLLGWSWTNFIVEQWEPLQVKQPHCSQSASVLFQTQSVFSLPRRLTTCPAQTVS